MRIRIQIIGAAAVAQLCMLIGVGTILILFAGSTCHIHVILAWFWVRSEFNSECSNLDIDSAPNSRRMWYVTSLTYRRFWIWLWLATPPGNLMGVGYLVILPPLFGLDFSEVRKLRYYLQLEKPRFSWSFRVWMEFSNRKYYYWNPIFAEMWAW